jgi:endonuclease-8
MPEGDTIFRAARTLHRALAGRTVTRFDSVFAKLARANDDLRMAGRTIERVDARGKHLLIWFSGDLVLRTHMRMHGSWHIYRPGERW